MGVEKICSLVHPHVRSKWKFHKIPFVPLVQYRPSLRSSLSVFYGSYVSLYVPV